MAENQICGKCGASSPLNARYCRICGTRLGAVHSSQVNIVNGRVVTIGDYNTVREIGTINIGAQWTSEPIPVDKNSSTLPEHVEPSMDQPIDFVLVTALEEERDAILNKLPALRQLPPRHDDIRIYYYSELPVVFSDGSKGAYGVVVMPLIGMGRIAAATATTDAIRRWSPRYVLLVGIAGGIAAREVRIGDILISDQVVDYELQKLTPNGPEIRWDVYRADARLLGACRNFKDEPWHDLQRVSRPGSGQPKRHIGPIASGDKVIAFAEVLLKYRSIWPKLIGVEMEAAGVAAAVFQSPHPPGFFMIRAASDLADEEKNSPDTEKWRSYACDAASSFVIALLMSGPVPLARTRMRTSDGIGMTEGSGPSPSTTDASSIWKSVGMIPSADFDQMPRPTHDITRGTPSSEKPASAPTDQSGEQRVPKPTISDPEVLVDNHDRNRQQPRQTNTVDAEVSVVGDRAVTQKIDQIVVHGSVILQQVVDSQWKDRIQDDDHTAPSGERQAVMAARGLRVFLCHASDDKPAIRTLYRELKKAGVEPWLDEEELLPGQQWQTEIQRAVRSSDAVLVCLSQKMIEKAGYVQSEVRLALEAATRQPPGRIFLIPARIEPCEVPDQLADWQWVDLFSSHGWERLLAALRRRAADVGAFAK